VCHQTKPIEEASSFHKTCHQNPFEASSFNMSVIKTHWNFFIQQESVLKSSIHRNVIKIHWSFLHSIWVWSKPIEAFFIQPSLSSKPIEAFLHATKTVY
jgi:hypothetical protein